MVHERAADRMIRAAVNIAAERALAALRLFREFESRVRTNVVHVFFKNYIKYLQSIYEN